MVLKMVMLNMAPCIRMVRNGHGHSKPSSGCSEYGNHPSAIPGGRYNSKLGSWSGRRGVFSFLGFLRWFGQKASHVRRVLIKAK